MWTNSDIIDCLKTRHIANGGTTGSAVSNWSKELDHFFVNENVGPPEKNSGPNPGTFRILVGVYPGLRQTTTPMENKKFHLCIEVTDDLTGHDTLKNSEMCDIFTLWWLVPLDKNGLGFWPNGSQNYVYQRSYMGTRPALSTFEVMGVGTARAL